MKNTFGQSVTLTLFGESHGKEIGCVLDGLAPGIAVSEESIHKALSLRRPQGQISTARQEKDPFRIVSGVYEGKTTGTPLCILIPNEDKRSSDYKKETALRPGHADLTAQMKYHGFQDPCGGGHFSGRITAPLVAAGAILRDALKKKGILIGTHIKSIFDVEDRSFEDFKEDILYLEEKAFATLSDAAKEEMEKVILAAKEDRDSVGGVLETAVIGVPGGVGEPWFDTLESVLSHALFSIPAIKGVEFGDGFALSKMRGSAANDAYYLDKDGAVKTKSNHCGGILGGISNGETILFRCAVKPTPTIGKEQETVSILENEEKTVSFGGRHDPCIVHRAGIVASSVTALVLCDMLTLRYGTDFLAEKAK
ncbi:MAG: chorismate synthase [Clostridia bacterium]|nr:chorismate synthase [Clostridia bacterium]